MKPMRPFAVAALAVLMFVSGCGEEHEDNAEADRDKNAAASDKDRQEAKAKRTKIAGAVKYHVKNLKDMDSTVRENSAEMLGLIASPDAVPYLIEALGDQVLMVKLKAHAALTKITGNSFDYREQKQWREWWKKEGKAFLEGKQKKARMEFLNSQRIPPNPTAPSRESSESDWKKELVAKMKLKIDLELDQVPLKEALDALRKKASITLIADPKVLEGGASVSIKAEQQAWEDALQLILKPAGLDYVLKDGAVFVAKSDQLLGDIELRIYDVRDLLAPIRDYSVFQDSSKPQKEGDSEAQSATITSLVKTRVLPDSWKPGQGISIEQTNGRLVVMQRPLAHDLIEIILRQLRSRRQVQVKTSLVLLPKHKVSGQLKKIGKASGDMLTPDEALSLDKASKFGAGTELTLFSGQKGSFSAGKAVSYNAGLDDLGVPRIKKLMAGLALELRTTVSGDAKFVTIEALPGYLELARMDRKETNQGVVEAPVLIEHRVPMPIVTVPDGSILMQEIPAIRLSDKKEEAYLLLLSVRVLAFENE